MFESLSARQRQMIIGFALGVLTVVVVAAILG